MMTPWDSALKRFGHVRDMDGNALADVLEAYMDDVSRNQDVTIPFDLGYAILSKLRNPKRRRGGQQQTVLQGRLHTNIMREARQLKADMIIKDVTPTDAHDAAARWARKELHTNGLDYQLDTVVQRLNEKI